MTAQTVQIRSRLCHIYGEADAEYLLLQMTDDHELQNMDSEVTAITQARLNFCLLLFRSQTGMTNFLRGKHLPCGESRASAAMLRTLCTF